MTAEEPTHTIAVELAQLTPIELDAFVSSYLDKPAKAQMYPADFAGLAAELLEQGSPGDLLSHIEHIVEGR